MYSAARRFRIWPIVAVALALTWLLVRGGSAHWILLRVAIAALVAGGAVRVLLARSRPRLQSAVVLAMGLLALGVGVGIAPPWLTKTRLSVTSIAGAVLVVGGVVLLVLGYIDVASRLRLWAKVLSGFGLVLLVAFTALTLAVAVAATNVPPTEVGETPALRGLAYDDVKLVTEDGFVLTAWYLASQNGAAVVLLHGAGSTRSSVLDEMEVLAANGYGVLAFDARGHGDSEGRAMDFGWLGNRDTLPAIQWLADRPDVENDRIALVGMSMGGEQAIGAAAFDRRVDAVVAEGVTARTAADKAWLPDVYGVQGWVQRLVDKVRFGITDVLTDAEPPIGLRDAATRIAPRHLLLITAGNAIDERNAATYIQSGSPGTVEVWEVPGAGHTQGLEVAPFEWEEQVIGFLDEVLLVGQ